MSQGSPASGNCAAAEQQRLTVRNSVDGAEGAVKAIKNGAEIMASLSTIPEFQCAAVSRPIQWRISRQCSRRLSSLPLSL
jgi:hypothetical protein